MVKKLSGVEKAATLLTLVGEEAATEIFKHLDPMELGRIIPMMARVKVSPEMLDSVVQEFHERTGAALMSVDEEYIKKILSKAFGED